LPGASGSARRGSDFERGRGRGRNGRPAPIPEVVALACRWLDEHECGPRSLTAAERAALWRDDRHWPLVGHAVDDSRDGLYGFLPGGRQP
jgi:hypothetical protein